MEPRTCADRIIRATLALEDPPLRIAHLQSLLRVTLTECASVAAALDGVCLRAEQAEGRAREVLVSVVDALRGEDPELVAGIQRLREEAAAESHLALERVLRQPVQAGARAALVPKNPNDDRIPDYGRGRTLTLGERKSLARRTDRDTLARLLLDPHPEVIRRLLRNPRMTEDDVVRLAAKRPARADVLTEIARSSTWMHRTQVRLAIALNPSTPVTVAGPIVSLLMRQELKLVLESTHVAPAVRALCLEHLARRPPAETEDGDIPVQ
jgi:hypothetical protein